MAAENVAGAFSMNASGSVGGTGSRVHYTGVIQQSGTMTVQDQVIPIQLSVTADGGFSPTSVSCAVAAGDVATEGRSAQEGAGVSTTVTGPFVARRTESPDATIEFEEAFAALVLEAEALIAEGEPAGADVLELAEKASDFYQNVFASGTCARGGLGLLSGKSQYTYFVKVIGQLILTALANPEVYDALDVNTLAIAALRIGVVGAAAPDPVLSATVLDAFRLTLEGKLAAAVAADDTVTCQSIVLTAAALGMTQIWTDAVTCVTG
jgi:hypothetical protein